MTYRFSGCNSLEHIGDCIKEIKGLPSNSASPTDTWIWIMKPNVQYQGITIPKCFFKLYITPASCEKENRRLGFDPDQHELDKLSALEYEGQIYMKVIQPLIDYRISPHFVKPFAHVENCSFSDLYRILEGKISGDARANLERNVVWIFYQGGERPAISDDKPFDFPDMPMPDFQGLNFGYMLNEAIDSDTTLSTKLREMLAIQPFNKADFYTILFQLAHAAYALNLSQTVHNDLHSGNAWIISSRPDNGINVEYTIDGREYFFEGVTVKAKLFDFDRAYCARLGKNPMLSDDSCTRTGQCNDFSGVRDFVKVMCYIIRTIRPVYPELAQELLEIFVPEALISEWAEAYARLGEAKCFLDSKILPMEKLKPLRKYPDIMPAIYAKYRTAFREAQGREVDDSGVPVQRFIMNADMFDQGALQRPEILPVDGYEEKNPERLLERAIGDTDLEKVKQLLSAGISPELVLIVASRIGNLRIVKYIKGKESAEYPFTDAMNATKQALFEAKRYNHPEVVDVLANYLRFLEAKRRKS